MKFSKKYFFYIVVLIGVCVISAVLPGLDAEKSLYACLKKGNYSAAVSIYNEKKFQLDNKNEIEQCLMDTVDQLFNNWDSDHSDDKDVISLQVFVDINNDKIAEKVEQYLEFICILECIEQKNYVDAVIGYNKHSLSEEYLKQVESALVKTVEKIVNDWEMADVEYEEAMGLLNVISEANNTALKHKCAESKEYLSVENAGFQILVDVETLFGNEDYLEVMVKVLIADERYSNYSLLEDYYINSKTIILEELGTPRTIDEYKQAIQKLQEYYNAVPDEAFKDRMNGFQRKLSEYQDIYRILNDASDLYEKNQQKKSFEQLKKGLVKYPNNKKLQYALSSYQYAYILTITNKVIDYAENKNYKEATELLGEAIEEYDCEEFQELLDQIREKSDVLYAAKKKLNRSGEYVYHSGKKLVLGDFADDEEDTLLSLGGSVAMAFTGTDTVLDVRDFAYDMTHWGEGDYFAVRLALDAVGIIPVIGAVKYIKHLDEFKDATKIIVKFDDAADTIHDVSNAVDNIHDVSNTVDNAHDASNLVDNVHDTANIIDYAYDTAKATDKAHDISKTVDGVVEEVIEDVARKADEVGDLADSISEISKTVDTAEDLADTAYDVSKKGGSYEDVFQNGEGELFEVHHMPANSANSAIGLSMNDGPCIKMEKADHHQTASWGSSKEARAYQKIQKRLVSEGKFKEALQMDIDDIRLKFGDKYDDAILEMEEYVEKMIQEGIVK